MSSAHAAGVRARYGRYGGTSAGLRADDMAAIHGARSAVTTMCSGVGRGISVLFEGA